MRAHATTPRWSVLVTIAAGLLAAPAAWAWPFFEFAELMQAYQQNDPCHGQQLLPTGAYSTEPGALDRLTLPSSGQSPAPSCPTSDNGAGQADQSQLQLVATQMRSQGLCCSPPDATSGMACRGHVADYPRDTVMFFPPHFQPRGQVETVLGLHGNFLDEKKSWGGNVLNEFHFHDLLAASGRRSTVLVVPLSDNLNTTYLNYFGGPQKNSQKVYEYHAGQQGLGRFMSGVNSLLGPPVTTAGGGDDHIKSLTVIGHSRAGLSISGVLHEPQGGCPAAPAQSDPCYYQKKIRSVHMIDATYWGGDALGDVARYKRAHPDVRLSVTFRNNGDGTRDGANYLCGQFPSCFPQGGCPMDNHSTGCPMGGAAPGCPDFCPTAISGGSPSHMQMVPNTLSTRLREDGEPQ